MDWKEAIKRIVKNIDWNSVIRGISHIVDCILLIFLFIICFPIGVLFATSRRYRRRRSSRWWYYRW